MLPSAVAELVHEACGEVLLLDARNSRALLSSVDGDELYAILRRLSNAGFSRFVDLTAIHLGDERFSLLLNIRAPEYGHVGLTLKWNWPPRPAVGQAAVPVQNERVQAGPPGHPKEEDTDLAVSVDPDLAGLGIAVHQIGPPAETETETPDAVEGTTAPGIALENADDAGYNQSGGAGQSGGQPWQTGPVAHPSLTPIWPGAGLMERELFELLGLPFTGNHNLDPLLIDAQFPDHPLRRDYMLPDRESYAAELLKAREEAALLRTLKSNLAARASVPTNDVNQEADGQGRPTSQTADGGGA